MTGESFDRAIAVAEAELAGLDMRRAAAVERLAALTEQRRASSAVAPDVGGPPVGWSAVRKVELFRSLFRGRDDVYPRRFESRRTGKSGYQPACAHEWARGLCEKPKVKCAECANRRFLQVTDETIRRHLSGQDDSRRDFVMGAYPMLLDETCFFLAADFDKASWRDDAGAFLETCRRMGLPAALERSRSGNGGHIWLFFDEAVPAALARKLGAHVLT